MSTTFQKCNKIYKNLFKLMFVSLIILVPMYWTIVKSDADFFSPMGIYQIYIFKINHEFSMSTRIIALAISFIPTFVVLYILGLFVRLFSCYEKLELFSTKVVSTYRKLGWAFIYWFMAQLIYSPLISFALSYGNPKGERFFAARISGIDFLALLFAGILMIIASVMQKAHDRKDEGI
ncbi:DUF2975 domain-containing protein [Francisellaceae bacterium CB300]|jgi:hypothetical protein